MKELFLKLLNFGIKPGSSAEVIERTKLVNGISFLGVPVCCTYIPIFFLTGYYYHALTFCVGIVIFILPLFINKWINVKVASVYIAVFSALFFGFISVLAGKDLGFYLGFLVISVPPVIIFPKLREGIIFTSISLLILILSILGNIFIPPLCEIPFAMPIYLLNLFTVLICSIAVVIFFKLELSESKAILFEKNKEIVDSINYAKKIQYALLAHDDLLKTNLPDHFVLFKPKDIVSGDFYWGTAPEVGRGAFYLAVCDSTGHGVPGAFMSLLNISFLNEAITEKGIEHPHEILNHVRQRLIQNISQEGAQDGMDGILIKMEKRPSGLKIAYAAANNSPVLISDEKIVELPYDKMPVGKGEKTESFTLHSLELKKGDTLYLFTDGYADQFGGPNGKKFKSKNLEELLLSINPLSMPERSAALNKRFEEWKRDLEQVDDVCIIGIKI